MLREFFQPVTVIYLKQCKTRLLGQPSATIQYRAYITEVNDNLLISAVSFAGVEESVTEMDQ